MKYVGAAEFKANCLRLMAEVQAGGEPITVTKRGKPMAVVRASEEAKPERGSLLGALAHPAYRFDDPFSPASDEPWDAEKGVWEPRA